MRVLDPTPNPRLAALSLQELGFIEFEYRVFGCAKGPGKPHVLRALKGLCEAMSGGYDYQIVEQAITAPVAWLLINALRHADMIEQAHRFDLQTEAWRWRNSFVHVPLRT